MNYITNSSVQDTTTTASDLSVQRAHGHRVISGFEQPGHQQHRACSPHRPSHRGWLDELYDTTAIPTLPRLEKELQP